jgi:hypothetical protein
MGVRAIIWFKGAKRLAKKNILHANIWPPNASSSGLVATSQTVNKEFDSLDWMETMTDQTNFFG